MLFVENYGLPPSKVPVCRCPGTEKSVCHPFWNIVDQAAYCPTDGSQALAKRDLVQLRLLFAAHTVYNVVMHWGERSFDRKAGFQQLLGKRPRHHLATGTGTEESDIGNLPIPYRNVRTHVPPRH